VPVLEATTPANDIADVKAADARVPAAAALPPLRVLMLLESSFTMKGGGGAESQVRTISRHLRRLGHRVAIVTPLLPWGPPQTAQRCFGLPIGRISYPRVPVVGGVIMGARLTALLLGRGRSYDAWHVHIGHHMAALACVLGRALDKPVVVKFSGSWEFESGALRPTRSPIDWFRRLALKQATCIQAISTRIAGEIERRGFSRDRILVLPNAVDTSRFKLRPPRKPGGPFTVVFVGRLVQEKDLPTLMDAWAEAFKGRTDVHLRLVGGGPLEETLKAQAERLGIMGQLEFIGHSDKVEELLADADIGVLPSRFEGLSNTMLEFMACGLPTIASRVSGSEDFIETGRNGWLVPVSDVGALRDALREASTLPADRLVALGRQARADVESRASLDRVVGQLMELYRRARPGDLAKAG